MATLEAPVRPRTTLHEGPFVTEPFYDSRNEENARRMRAAIAKVRGQLGREYDLIVGGKRVRTTEKIKSLNPSQPSQIVGIHQKAGKEHVEPAMKAALEAFESRGEQSWSRTTVDERASLLFRVGDLLRQRKMEYMAWLVFEVSKNWAEADADISETIDFCEFYAREALRLSKVQPPIQLPGERDTLVYIPLGVGAVIPPWNFPCAIMAGMTLASIVSGNTVILKPSSDSPTIAAKFMDVLEEAGMPEGVVNFCPGSGATFGDAVVAHPKTRFIAFTGSREVGLNINKVAANQAPGQLWIKPTIFADIPPKSKLEQEEIFGPVLAVIKARGFDHALEIANDTEFGLTGAVYTSSRDKVERAIREFHVGNLYINRKCTGAMVGAHPFGGFNMSGTDSKSGGPDYLYLFTQAKVVGEKIV